MATERFSRHLLRMARRQAGLTQAELAKEGKTSQSAISAYESGRRSPSMDTLVRLIGAAGLEIRVRLAEPDTHETARQRGEELLDSVAVQRFHDAESKRVSEHTSSA